MAGRRNTVKLRAAGIAIALTGLTLPGIAHARSLTPSETVIACTVEPVSVDLVVSWYFDASGNPVATPASLEPVNSEADLPQGGAVDEATADAVSAVVREWNACFAAGQYARAFGLMTDHGVRQFGPDLSDPTEDTPEEVRALLESQIAGTPTPDEGGDNLPAFNGPFDMRLLDDGRVGASWGFDNDLVFIIVAKQGDAWLIDDFIEITDDATPTT